MKPFINKKITKNLIIILVIMSILTSTLPNYVQAATNMDEGYDLLEPIEKFVVFLCDKVMQWLQDYFVTTDKIDKGSGTFEFKYSPAIIFSGDVPAFAINFINPNVASVYGKESTAKVLQSTIASWYNALRRIAIVGLLSVLVYVGIRIVLTSSSQDKAKYKGMLKDWLVAMCLLFTLHYIMSLTITVTQEISAIFSTGESDVLLNTLRGEIYGNDSTTWKTVLAEVIIYVVIVIFTVIYTIQYFKRVIYMAFYTLIAPLITLTYPLDKIKDGQAQAFTMWIREYIFTALTQVIHLVIYFVFVSSAMSLVDDYWLYAIVVLTFMKKAEDMIKKMFGFNKSETVGTLGKAAAGGMMMNLFNKMTAPIKAPKGGDGGSSGGKSNIRTATNPDVLSTIRNGGPMPSPTPSPASPTPNPSPTPSPTPNPSPTPSPTPNPSPTPSPMPSPMPSPTPNPTPTPTQTTTKPKRSIKGAAGSLIKRYHRKVLGGGLGILTGGAGAMIGFAAGVAQGDLGVAFGGAIAGGKAGYNVGGRVYNGTFDIPKNIRTTLNNIGDTYNEGAYGEEYANNVKFDREFRRSSTYKALRQKYGDNFSDEYVRKMLEAGITDQKAMDKILKNVTGQNGYSIEDAMGYYALKKQCKDAGVYYDDDKLRQWLEDNGFGQINDLTQIKDHMKNF